MSLKNAFVKLGLVEEDVAPTKAAPGKPTKTSAATTKTAPVFTPEPEPTQEIDPEISEMLQQSLQEKKTAGFDYLKFVSMVDKMKGKVSSEEAQYQTAFSAAEELGVTKNALVKSGGHYLEVLKEDEDDFTENCADFEKKEVKSRETQLSQIETNITETTKQLEQLNEQRDSLTKELEEKRASLESRKSSFQTTVETFKNNIQSNIEKINQYLS